MLTNAQPWRPHAEIFPPKISFQQVRIREKAATAATRVARWYIFRPKFAIWVNFGGSCNGRCWYVLWTFGLLYGHLIYFTAIWSIIRTFDIFYGHLMYFVVIWHIFPRFGISHQEKSGNPGGDQRWEWKWRIWNTWQSQLRQHLEVEKNKVHITENSRWGAAILKWETGGISRELCVANELSEIRAKFSSGIGLIRGSRCLGFRSLLTAMLRLYLVE
jgi:hypothetical protein